MYVNNNNNNNFFDIWEKSIWPFDLCSRSKVMTPNESPYMISYMSILEIKPQSLIVIEKSTDFTLELWTLTSRGQSLGSRSKVMAPIESSYMISYMTTIQNESLSLVVFKIVEKKFIWPLTFVQGQRSWHQIKGHIWFPICPQHKLSLYLL